jgi:nitrogen fixation protein NifU and related proteins
MNFYQEIILDHYRHPRNQGIIADAHFTSGQYNPSCGDRIEITGKVLNNVLSEVMFTGSGCVISQASASLLTQAVCGKTIEEIKMLKDNDMCALIGIQLGAMRIKCALLALHALQEGLLAYRLKHSE